MSPWRQRMSGLNLRRLEIQDGDNGETHQRFRAEVHIRIIVHFVVISTSILTLNFSASNLSLVYAKKYFQRAAVAGGISAAIAGVHAATFSKRAWRRFAHRYVRRAGIARN